MEKGEIDTMEEKKHEILEMVGRLSPDMVWVVWRMLRQLPRSE